MSRRTGGAFLAPLAISMLHSVTDGYAISFMMLGICPLRLGHDVRSTPPANQKFGRWIPTARSHMIIGRIKSIRRISSWKYPSLSRSTLVAFLASGRKHGEEMSSTTLRLTVPQWQGGDEPAYRFGANLLDWLAPPHDGSEETIDVPESDGTSLERETSIKGRTPLLAQQARPTGRCT